MAQTYRYITTPKEVIGTRDGQDFYVGGAQVAVADNPASGSGSNGNNANQQGSSPPPVNNPVTPTVDPITDYYNKLADPAVADQPLREQIQKNMQTALDAIDQKYVSIYADRLGQTRALNSRSGTMGDDFGNANMDRTKTATDQQKGAEQNAVRVDYEGQLNKLASDEIAARRTNELGKAQAAQAQYEKNQKSAQDLIVNMAKTNQTLTPAQKEVLMRNSGYDQNTFDLLYNSSKPGPAKIDYTYDKDAHAFYGVDPTTGKLSIVKDTSFSADADIVLEIMKKYPDAGITLQDNLASAQSKIANSKIYKKDIRIPDSTPTNPTNPPKDYPTAAKIDDWIVANKKANPDMAYTDLWGQLADQLKQQGVNPTDFDKEFWRILHPEGLAGYDKYVKKTGANSSADIANPFK